MFSYLDLKRLSTVNSMLLGLPRYCSASGMFADAHGDGFHAIMRKRVASLLIVAAAPQLAALSAGGAVTYPSVLLQQLKTNRSTINLDFDTASWIGWILAFAASSTAMILFSETFHGLGTNSLLAVSLLSLSEMVGPKYRNVSMQMFGTVQALGMAIVGVLVRFVHWKTMSLVMSLPIIAALIIAFMWPESPSWLACKGEFDRCEKAFIWLRGSDDESKKELKELISAQKENIRSNRTEKNSKTFWMQVTSRDFYLPSVHMFLLLNMMYWSGSAVVLIYSIDMLKKATGNEDAAFLGGIAINLILFFGVATCSILVKFYNNKTVLLSSTFAAALTLFCNSLVSFLQSLEVIPKDSLLSLYFLIAFMVPNCLGLNSIVFIIGAELMPVKHRNLGGALYVIYNCALLSSSLKISPYMFLYIDLWGTFLLYALYATLCGFLVWRYIPETKGRTLQEIEDYYSYGRFEVTRDYHKVDSELLD